MALLREDPHPVRGHRGPKRWAFRLRERQGALSARLHASAAERAALVNNENPALQPQNPEGAGLHTLPAGSALVLGIDDAHVYVFWGRGPGVGGPLPPSPNPIPQPLTGGWEGAWGRVGDRVPQPSPKITSFLILSAGPRGGRQVPEARLPRFGTRPGEAAERP